MDIYAVDIGFGVLNAWRWYHLLSVEQHEKKK